MRRAAWNAGLRYTGHYNPKPGLATGQSFNDGSYPGGVFTPAQYPEMYNNTLLRLQKHLNSRNLNNNNCTGLSHPKSAVNQDKLLNKEML